MIKLIKLYSLYGHWVKCSEIFETVKYKPINVETLGLPKDFNDKLSIFMRLNRLAVAYGLLYVVIEGYQKLKLQDEEIDVLLRSTDYLFKLKKFRNSIFHYQEHPLSKKFWDFIFIPDSEQWIKKLKKAFEKYFSATLNTNEVIENFKKSLSE